MNLVISLLFTVQRCLIMIKKLITIKMLGNYLIHVVKCGATSGVKIPLMNIRYLYIHSWLHITSDAHNPLVKIKFDLLPEKKTKQNKKPNILQFGEFRFIIVCTKDTRCSKMSVIFIYLNMFIVHHTKSIQNVISSRFV